MKYILFTIQLPKEPNLTALNLSVLFQQTNQVENIPLILKTEGNRVLMIHPFHENDFCFIEVELLQYEFSTDLRCSICGKSRQWKKKAFADSSREYLSKAYWANQFGLHNAGEFLFKGTLYALKSSQYDSNGLREEEQYYFSLIRLIKITFHAD